jgi:biopolymer transport protein ExbB
MTLSSLTQLAHTSGGILYLMALLLFVALAVMIERAWALSRMLGRGRQWIRELKSQPHLDHGALQALLERDATSPHAHVVAAAVRHDMADGFDRLPDQLEEAVMDEAPRVDRGLWMLDTIVTLAPLLGLLGTIVGMFNTFQALSSPGAGTAQVTGGVGEALLATAAGLLIAVIGLVAFNGLNQRVRLVMHQLERIKVILANRVYPHYRPGGVHAVARPKATAAAAVPTSATPVVHSLQRHA